MTLERFAKHVEERLPVEKVADGGGLLWALDTPGIVSRDGVWLEFGVSGGYTLNAIAKRRGPQTKLWGLDSFRGLPEDWNDRHPKGTFGRDSILMPPDGVNLLVGWYKDTLGSFHPSGISFVHLDCDLYSAGRTCLDWLGNAPLHESGCVLVLDDCFTPPLDNGVLRALHETHSYWNHIDWLLRPEGTDVAVVRLRQR